MVTPLLRKPMYPLVFPVLLFKVPWVMVLVSTMVLESLVSWNSGVVMPALAISPGKR